MSEFRTIIEPFRIHAVEPIRMTTEAEREAALREAGWNLFDLHAQVLGDGGRGICLGLGQQREELLAAVAPEVVLGA